MPGFHLWKQIQKKNYPTFVKKFLFIEFLDIKPALTYIYI